MSEPTVSVCPPPPPPPARSAEPPPAPSPQAAEKKARTIATPRASIALTRKLRIWVLLLEAILFEVTGDGDAARRTCQQALRRALRGHRRLDRQHAAGRAEDACAQAGGADLREARGPQPDRLGQGPGGQVDDRAGRGRERDRSRPDDPRADLRQHRDLAGDDLPAQRLPAQG